MPNNTKTMPHVDKCRINVAPQELLWLYQNVDSSLKNLIKQRLTEKGINVSRELIHKELCTLKETYHSGIIKEARALLWDVKKIVYK
ncbi:hypothetical protein ACR78H_25020 [Sphingobacterium siyangense]|uniref:hypothetical protein n=1 Tax=Sphingobacterium siyangense TaxID=459529 RepID=UPI003DA47B66